MYDVFIKLGVSALLGLIIGLERELKGKPVGLKTSLVISIVSCLLTMVSIESAYAFKKIDHITMDPMRLAAQIVSGIGFLGAGVILRRGNDSISGLTTAAIIWGAAGIGIAVGAGFFIEAISGLVLLILSVELIPYLFTFIGPRRLREKELILRLKISYDQNATSIIEQIILKDIRVKNIRIKDLEGELVLLQASIHVSNKRIATDVYYDIQGIDGVKSIEVES
ncbi:MgtC/SapB family protein [Priestia koreensis]|uniref:MgtC/SapB family protein n=1 Tax=Priestia koreensis TaxID=284581 RepID=UPI00203E4941|nr:MgtC/SapB family protein [Priestia koreensis]MCM3004383.1 MgtC/SapB family protein [Priestia koreensis]